MAAPAGGRSAGRRPVDPRGRRDRRRDRTCGPRLLRPHLVAGAAPGRGRRLDGRRGGVRDAPYHAPAPESRSDARGGVGGQRPGRDRADPRADLGDREARLPDRRPHDAAHPAARARPARRRRAGHRGDLALRADSCVDRALRPGRVGRNRRARLRCGRRDPRQRVPRRLPRRARGRLDAVALPGPARDVPHRGRLRGAGRAVHRPRPARLPFAAARRRARVARRDGGARAARAAARRLGLGRAAAPLHHPRARAARVGGAPRGGADRARHLRPLLARLGRGHDLQCSVLRRAGVDRAAGDDPRVARAPARPARRPCRPRSRPSRSRGRGAR